MLVQRFCATFHARIPALLWVFPLLLGSVPRVLLLQELGTRLGGTRRAMFWAGDNLVAWFTGFPWASVTMIWAMRAEPGGVSCLLRQRHDTISVHDVHSGSGEILSCGPREPRQDISILMFIPCTVADLKVVFLHQHLPAGILTSKILRLHQPG
jgi:hypothetical protein